MLERARSTGVFATRFPRELTGVLHGHSICGRVGLFLFFLFFSFSPFWPFHNSNIWVFCFFLSLFLFLFLFRFSHFVLVFVLNSQFSLSASGFPSFLQRKEERGKGRGRRIEGEGLKESDLSSNIIEQRPRWEQYL